MSLMDYIKDESTSSSSTPDDAHHGPSNWWYLAHVPFGFASGPLCHAIWEDRHQKKAELHLMHGIMLSAGTWIAAGVTLMFSFA